jgi:hypothetical protein
VRENGLERLFVVVPLRRDQDCHIGSGGLQDCFERLQRRHAIPRSSGRFGVALFVCVDDPDDVVLKTRGGPGQRFGHRRHADDDQGSRWREWLDVNLYRSLGYTRHGHDDVLGIVGVRRRGIGPDRYEA